MEKCMKKKAGIINKLHYSFDNFMSRGPLALIGGLALLSVFIILFTAALISFGGAIFRPVGTEGMGFFEAAWASLIRTLDAGTMADDEGWGFRWIMLFATLGGVFVISALIGVLSTGLEDKLEELRKGRSLVLENGHTVILGWSPQVFTILQEIIIANENQRRPAISILAEMDKVEMEDEIRKRIPKPKNTRIICRSGLPYDNDDLVIVSPDTARSIIIIPPEDEDADSFVIKTTLALCNSTCRTDKAYNIITQYREEKNHEILKMISKEDRLCAVNGRDIIARVTAQASRQAISPTGNSWTAWILRISTMLLRSQTRRWMPRHQIPARW